MPVELLGQSADELREFAASIGEREYRAAQLYHALYAERRFDFAAMTNLPAAFCVRVLPKRRASRFRESRAGLLPWTGRFDTCSRSARKTRSPRKSRPSSCPRKAARRFAFRPRRAAPSTAISA